MGTKPTNELAKLRGPAFGYSSISFSFLHQSHRDGALTLQKQTKCPLAAFSSARFGVPRRPSHLCYWPKKRRLRIEPLWTRFVLRRSRVDPSRAPALGVLGDPSNGVHVQCHHRRHVPREEVQRGLCSTLPLLLQPVEPLFFLKLICTSYKRLSCYTDQWNQTTNKC